MKVYEYRCTRDSAYQGNCMGATNLDCRQGHYVDATTKERALAVMAKRFPEDVAKGYWFTVTEVGVAWDQIEDVK